MWDNDACMFNCLTHTIFNRSDPQHAYGKFFVDSADKLVNVSVINSSTSAVYTGDRFGCQLSLVNEVCSLGCLGISFCSHALLWAHLQPPCKFRAVGLHQIFWGQVRLPALTCQSGALLGYLVGSCTILRPPWKPPGKHSKHTGHVRHPSHRREGSCQ